jgi:CheY-like chemotaxis protein
MGVSLPKLESDLEQASDASRPGQVQGNANHPGWVRGGADCVEAYREVLDAVAVAEPPATRCEAEAVSNCFTALLRTLRSEPVERRAALALIAVEGLTPEEAGEVLGQDAGTVRLLANTARNAVIAGSRGFGARILIAEDERVAAFELREVLRGFGHKVVAIASTVEAAVSRAVAERPDLVLVDVRLRGGEDGIGAMQAMREAVGVPAIVVTAFGDQRGRAEGASGSGHQCYGFMLKPWAEGELRVAVADALIRIAAERAASTPSALPTTA